MNNRITIGQGSTQLQLFRSEVDLRLARVYFSYVQYGQVVLERSSEDEDMLISPHLIAYNLTQEETLKLSPGNVNIQVRYVLPDKKAGVSFTLKGTVVYANKGGVI